MVGELEVLDELLELLVTEVDEVLELLATEVVEFVVVVLLARRLVAAIAPPITIIITTITTIMILVFFKSENGKQHFGTLIISNYSRILCAFFAQFMH